MAQTSEYLGEGDFGKVYKEVRGGTTCAVKKIKDYDRGNLQEAQTLMGLDHEYIIKCLGYHTEDSGQVLCIVMEFADRGTMTEYTIFRGTNH